MTASEIRISFFNFFKSKNHQIVDSAPMVVKSDPTLMFTNAGMNQFKDIFLGNSPIKFNRIANSQKCLRVSGKHNDLEEVGHDTYHHTMFEMLGNWSFGDYFKKEAISWAWEYLVDILKINKDRLYATIFEGSLDDDISKDNDAFNIWLQYLPKNRIIDGSKKDNFWEMGSAGPCGPCSEIHIDLRDDKERNKTDGKLLVNKDHPLVIEIWNLVFIQYNRKANGVLEPLPKKHVDTGMGFERLCMVMQNKKSNYDTDIFQTIIAEIEKITCFSYGKNEKIDIAMRVIADHIRAITFAITDGQLPSNNKAGYVIRRILRRAVRYGYTFLNQNEPLLFKLITPLIKVMGDAYPELTAQKELLIKVIKEEELSFLRTLETGIKLLDSIIKNAKKSNQKIISGKQAFELYDTYGFPLDLTELIAREHNFRVNINEFNIEMKAQKDRSRNATKIDTDDWIELGAEEGKGFVGYNTLESDVKIVKYRKIKQKGKDLFQLVFDNTPFYAESGGQVGDTGYIEADEKKISIINTLKENNLTIHITSQLPENTSGVFKAVVNKSSRISTESNHSATHLLHKALREVLGNHVEQKGSLVHPDYLRFDFSHFQKVTDEELKEIEEIVNKNIRLNFTQEEENLSYKEAVDKGAMALFGEKYGDEVRVIKFGDSVELCGGTHVKSTGQIGFFKIISESAISAGIRRIEAISGEKAQKHINHELETLIKVKKLLNNPKNPADSVQKLIEENNQLLKKIELLNKEKQQKVKKKLKDNINKINGINVISGKVEIESSDLLRDLSFQLKNEIKDLYLVLASEIKGKPNIVVMISENLVNDKKLHAGNIIREAAKEINGGGGGQPFFATAGGSKTEGIEPAIQKALSYIK